MLQSYWLVNIAKKKINKTHNPVPICLQFAYYVSSELWSPPVLNLSSIEPKIRDAEAKRNSFHFHFRLPAFNFYLASSFCLWTSNFKFFYQLLTSSFRLLLLIFTLLHVPTFFFISFFSIFFLNFFILEKKRENFSNFFMQLQFWSTNYFNHKWRLQEVDWKLKTFLLPLHSSFKFWLPKIFHKIVKTSGSRLLHIPC